MIDETDIESRWGVGTDVGVGETLDNVDRSRTGSAGPRAARRSDRGKIESIKVLGVDGHAAAAPAEGPAATGRPHQTGAGKRPDRHFDRAPRPHEIAVAIGQDLTIQG